jgi:hypothetical protein
MSKELFVRIVSIIIIIIIIIILSVHLSVIRFPSVSTPKFVQTIFIRFSVLRLDEILMPVNIWCCCIRCVCVFWCVWVWNPLISVFFQLYIRLRVINKSRTALSKWQHPYTLLDPRFIRKNTQTIAISIYINQDNIRMNWPRYIHMFYVITKKACLA